MSLSTTSPVPGSRSAPGSVGARRLRAAIAAAKDAGRPAIAAFLTGGYPSRDEFEQFFSRLSEAADIIEIGIPFSDPMADGVTIQDSSQQALEEGFTLPWLFRFLGGVRVSAPVVLMSYLNPLLAYGLTQLAEDAARVDVAGLIVPDLPLEESGPVRQRCRSSGIALIQLVTPLTPPDRLRYLCTLSEGFVYAVTIAGTTGTPAQVVDGMRSYLDRVREFSSLPVLAGFGIRDRAQVRELSGHADGFVVGSALIEAIAGGRDPVRLLDDLRPATVPSGTRSA